MNQRNKRRRRIRAKIKGTAARPRCCVFRSNRHIFVQFIDDEAQRTLLAMSDMKLKKESRKKKPLEVAFEVGQTLAQKAKKAGVKSAVFDRGGYSYHGQVRSVAEGVRKGGIRI